MSNVRVSPQDSVSNIGLRNLPSSRNSQVLRHQCSISSKSSNTMISGEHSKAALIMETSTLHKRQAIQMEECLIESEIQKTQLEQDCARLELEHRKEQLKLETEVLKIQARKDEIISHPSSNGDHNYDEKLQNLTVVNFTSATGTRMSRPKHSWMDETRIWCKSVRHMITPLNAKRKRNFNKGNSLTLLERSFDYQETGINSENTEGKISQDSPEQVEISSTSQTTIKYACCTEATKGFLSLSSAIFSTFTLEKVEQ